MGGLYQVSITYRRSSVFKKCEICRPSKEFTSWLYCAVICVPRLKASFLPALAMPNFDFINNILEEMAPAEETNVLPLMVILRPVLNCAVTDSIAVPVFPRLKLNASHPAIIC